MKKNWDDYKYVLALSRFGTLTAAAERLGANAATVSRRVARLEESMGVTLFERSDSGWRPTPAADRLAELSTRFERDVGEVWHEAAADRTDPIGNLFLSGVGFVNSIALLPRLDQFSAAFPRLSLILESSMKPHSLAFGEADIALRVARPVEGRLVIRRIARFHLGIYRNRRHATMPGWIGLTAYYNSFPAMLQAYDYFGTEPAVRVSSIMGVFEVLRHSGRPGPLPRCVARLDPDLEPLLAPGDNDQNDLWLVYHESRRKDPKVAAAVEWLGTIFPSQNACVCGQCPAQGE
jgi:DNA-binding transcriptional LysR family regulator